MSLSAAVVRELVRAGLKGDALSAACERIEDADRARTTAERVRAHRARKQAETTVDVTDNVTDVTTNVTSPPQDKKAPPDPPKKTQPQNTPPSIPTGYIPPKPKGKTALPADWQPDEELVAYAVAQGHSRQKAFEIGEDMRVWAQSKGERRASWPATYQNFCRRDAKENRRSNRGPPSQGPSYSDIRREAERQLAELESQQHDPRPDPVLRLVSF